MFRRARFGELVGRQLDLFAQEQRYVLEEAEEKLRLYNAAERAEAEELYGDYVDAVETGADALADLRDHYARSLEEAEAETYAAEFNRAASRRFPRFADALEHT